MVAARNELTLAVATKLEQVSRSCTTEIGAETKGVLKRTLEELEQLPRCREIAARLKAVEQNQLPAGEAMDLLKTSRADVEKLLGAMSGGDGVVERVRRADDAASAARQFAAAANETVSRLAACEQGVVADKSLCESGRLKSGFLAKLGDAQGTLGSRMTDLEQRDQKRWPEVRGEIKDTIDKAAAAIQSPERAIVAWLAGQKWRGAPKFEMRGAELLVELAPQTDEILGACNRIRVAAVFAVDGASAQPAVSLCGLHSQSSTRVTSCTLEFKGDPRQPPVVKSVVINWSSLEDGRKGRDSKKACVGSVTFGSEAAARALRITSDRQVQVALALPE
jgi:hypothetical protein